MAYTWPSLERWIYAPKVSIKNVFDDRDPIALNGFNKVITCGRIYAYSMTYKAIL